MEHLADDSARYAPFLISAPKDVKPHEPASLKQAEGVLNNFYLNEIIAENIQLGPRFSQSPNQKQPPTPPKTTPAPEEEIPIIEEGEDINVDEIPF